MANDPLPDPPPDDLLRRLSQRPGSASRYKLEGEVARGGMGSIIKIWDEDLRRHLAMKVVLGKGDDSSSGSTPSIESKRLARFLEEAQVTGQLDHPGIVPVHEVGLDSDGRVYFTMKLVKGRDLKHIFDLVFAGKEGWNETRALGVILKVCEAMAYAHAKGVIHRDLKPANVMVGSFGEVYVMDWGLSRVLGRNDKHDIRIKPDFSSSVKSVKTERREAREETPDSPIVTMDGDVMGTPAYMAPEQARGEIEKLGPQSDVYSIGAMLYHLLARQMPYVPPGEKITNRTVLARVLDGPPKPIASLRQDVPAELVAIGERAMARDAESRYPDTLALAADLRAYLEQRVVGAYETGTWAETRKWVRRNRPLAVSLAAGIVVLIIGVASSALLAKHANAKAHDADQARNELAAKNEKLVEANTKLLAGELDSMLRGLIFKLNYFETLDDDVYAYARKQHRPASEWWLEDARELLNGAPNGIHRRQPGLKKVEEELAKLRERAVDRTPVEAEADRATSETMVAPRQDVADFDHDGQRPWHFEQSADEWWYGELVKLVAGLKRLEKQVDIAMASVEPPEAKRAWEEAINAIAGSEKYRGTKWPSGNRPTPQLGLLPIGPDPDSGLWEFAHLASGKPPRRGSDGRLTLEPDMGLVLVLLPGGCVPTATSNGSDQDGSIRLVDLDPFLISKYEMTNAQWFRLGGELGSEMRQAPQTLVPVHTVSWQDCTDLLLRAGAWLCLPSEAQWEYGCRAGTSSLWWTGDSEDALAAAGNFRVTDVESKRWIQDIGQRRANPFGLHDVHGNVAEWCTDAPVNRSMRGPWLERRLGDGLLPSCAAPLLVEMRAVRGGSYNDTAFALSSSRQIYFPRTARYRSIYAEREGQGLNMRFTTSTANDYDTRGVRPARGITP